MTLRNLVQAAFVTVSVLPTLITDSALLAADPINVGTRLEPLVDDYLVGSLSGDVKLKLHRPEPGEVVLTTDKPWEGNTCAYYTIFRDGDKFRMYYRGSHYNTKTRKATHPEVACYAESRDGRHWTKPNLGLFEFNGSKNNNIVWNGIGSHCFTPFKDSNPNCNPDARYKALSRGRPHAKKGLYAFHSADGIHWNLTSKTPVITVGAFDSQNLAFWDAQRKLYVAYYRHFRKRTRDIMTCTSKDFLHWTKPEFLKIGGAPREHLYTNAVQPYPGAPHIHIGFPTRYLPKGSQVAPTMMTSRDRLNFHRWASPVIPSSAPKDRAGNRSNYMTHGILQLPGKPGEFSVYATEAYYTGPDSRVRRFTYRKDGFVSLNAGSKGGVAVTKPFRHSGSKLVINFKTKKTGGIRVEILDAAGKPMKGFTTDECVPLSGDSLQQTVKWDSSHLPDTKGKPIRIKFVMTDADVYSLRFVK